MPDFPVGPDETVSGGTGNDYFLVDPNNLNAAEISDPGGIDTLVVYDRPGRTAGEFAVEDDNLVWRNFEGDSVTMALGQIEFFEWRRLPEDGTPYTMRSRIFISDDAIAGSKFVLAGTQGDDDFESPLFRRFKTDWSEIYGNGGDDRLVGSNKHNVILYGGEGNDLLLGVGQQDDDFVGDGGRDILRGAGGDDNLGGGRGGDTLFGGVGADSLTGEAGNDRLVGGSGPDKLIFNGDLGNEGRDRLVGFTIGEDSVLLRNFDDDFVELSFASSAAGAVVTLGDTGTRLVFVGLTAVEVEAAQDNIFAFV